jgi:methionine biosynthesis protein MetW
VIQMDLEAGLSGFEDQSFDTVILSQTLQAMHNTQGIVQEMLRVGREVIVTFPNFGYWRHRAQLIEGRMPVSKNLPYQWYDTPNVHLCTINDFDQFCVDCNIQIKERLVLTDNKPVTFMPNLLGSLAMYRLKKN